jgi:hypothetical protein
MQNNLLICLKLLDRPYGDSHYLSHLGRDFVVRNYTDPIQLVQDLSPGESTYLLTDRLEFALLSEVHAKCDAKVLLITSETMETYSQALQGQENQLVQHLFADNDSGEFLLQELSVALKKIASQDLFGVEKYLKGANQTFHRQIRGSRDRIQAQTDVLNFAESIRLSGTQTRLAAGITEELVMNAIFDAPAASGIDHYQSIRRGSEVVLEAGHESTLTLAFDGRILGISVLDPFGAMTRGKLYQYIRKVLVRSDSNQLIDTKELGAGLGLYKILYSCHSLICNIEPGKHTEVIALIDCERQLRDFSRSPRSIQYFEKS